MIKSFRELEVWRKAHQLVLDIYDVTERFPDHERYGVTSQMRRAAVSIPANIAEGFGRRTTKELLQCLTISRGSLEEVRYFLILSFDRHYLPAADRDRLEQRCDSVGQMLNALVRSLRSRSAQREIARLTNHESRTTSPGLQEGKR